MASKNVQSFNDVNFESDVLKSNVPVLVDFTATWCGPCKALAPIVEKLADEFSGQVRVGKCDIDDAPNVAAKYRVRSVPTVMVFKNGELVVKNGKVVKVVQGATHVVKPDFDKSIEKPLNDYFDRFLTVRMENFKLADNEIVDGDHGAIIVQPTAPRVS